MKAESKTMRSRLLHIQTSLAHRSALGAGVAPLFPPSGAFAAIGANDRSFFEAWFGGAPTYFDAAWPPGLKALHEPVSISRGMAERWLGHFLASFAETVKDPTLIHAVQPLIARLALALINRTDEPVTGERLRDLSDPRFLRAVQRNDAAAIAALAAAQPHLFRLHGPRLLLVAALRG
jgi:truncated hemoglobin YjbI